MLGDPVGIVRLIFARCSKLRSIDLWRIRLPPNTFLSMVQPVREENPVLGTLSSETSFQLGRIYSLADMPVDIHSVAHMTQLMELDLGWTSVPAHFIKDLVKQAGKRLIKIFLTACRRK